MEGVWLQSAHTPLEGHVFTTKIQLLSSGRCHFAPALCSLAHHPVLSFPHLTLQALRERPSKSSHLRKVVCVPQLGSLPRPAVHQFLNS